MVVLWAILYLCIIVFVGASVFGLIARNTTSWHETVALSLALGLGVTGIAIFWLALAGVKPMRLTVMAIGLFSIAGLVLCGKKGRWPLCRGDLKESIRRARTDPGLCALAIVIAVVTTVIWLHAFTSPLFEWDAFAIWGFKAKVLMAQGLRPRPEYFQDLSLGFSHADYPLLVPCLTAGAYGMMGGMDDRWGKIWIVLVQFSLGLIVYGGVRRHLDARRSAVLTTIFISLPVLARWTGAGTADAALALFFAGSVRYLIAYQERGTRGDLFLASLFTAFCAFTKNDGLALAALNSMLLLCFALVKFSWRKVGEITAFILIWLTLSSPWLIWSRSIPRINENYFGRLSSGALLENTGRLASVATEFLRQMARWDYWGLLWLILFLIAAASFLRRRRREEADRVSRSIGLMTLAAALWLILLGQLGLYALGLMLSSWEVKEVAASALARLFLHASPVAIFLIGLHWATLSSGRLQRTTA